MRVLITTEGDVEGQVFAPVASELLRRGHEVDVYSKYTLAAFNIEFTRIGIAVKPLSELWGRERDYDVALVYRDVQNSLKYNKVPMAYIVFGPNASEQRVIGGQFFLADVMFVSSENAKRNLRRNGYDGEVFVTGQPKFDPLFHMEKTSEKLVVIPDTPNCPWGEGRQRYFDILVEAARRYSEYDFWIKPRFMLGEQWSSAGFLCGHDRHMEFFARDCKDLPSNLRVLDEYYSMNELAARCSLMVSAPTSALMTQMVLHKSALMISDAVKPDSLMYNAMYRANQETYNPSGCGVWMDELLDTLPHGLSPNPDWVEREIGPYDGKASQRIATVLEQMARGGNKGVQWVPKFDSTVGDFADRYGAYIESVDSGGTEFREKEERVDLFRVAQRGLKALHAFASDVGEGIDFSLEIDRLENSLGMVASLPLQGENLRKSVYAILVEIGLWMDKFWGYQQNSGFFKGGLISQANDFTYTMGLKLSDLDMDAARAWCDESRKTHGATMLDYIFEGPDPKSDEACRNIGVTLYDSKCMNLAVLYGTKALRRGRADIPVGLMELVLKVVPTEEQVELATIWCKGNPEGTSLQELLETTRGSGC